MKVSGIPITGKPLDRPSWRRRMMGVVTRAKVLGHDLGPGPFSRRELLKELRGCRNCACYFNLPMVERGDVRMFPCANDRSKR